MSKPPLGNGDGLRSRLVWRWILIRWQCGQDFAQLVMSLARLCQTNLENTRRREASLTGWERLCKCKKKIFRNFAGTMGRKNSMVTSPTRHLAPACRKASLRDEPPSKHCVSAQQFCSAAMASKSTGPAYAAAATVPDGSIGGGGGVGWTENQQRHFSDRADTTSAQ
jgi:hypothetical protein